MGYSSNNSFFISNGISFKSISSYVNYIFAVKMGHYNSFTEYNETKARQRQVHKIYAEGQGNEWQWDNKKNRIHFDKL